MIYSHTSLEMFDQCPYRFKRMYVDKDTPRLPQSQAQMWGIHVHEGIDMYMNGKDMPLSLSSFLPQVEPFKLLEGDKAVELPLSVDTSWQPVQWSTGMFRGKVDLVNIYEAKATVIDWKTGSSRYANDRQQRRYAALVFASLPQVEVVDTRWVYLKERTSKPRMFCKADEQECRDTVLTPITNISECRISETWDKHSGPLCRFCEVMDCEFRQ